MLWRKFLVCMLVPMLSLAGPRTDESSIEVLPWNVTVNNSVAGTIIDGTWDPGDPVTISGKLMANGGSHCVNTGTAMANMDSLIILLNDAEEPSEDPGYTLCNGQTRIALSPGTNSSGEFSFELQGGGVSWILGDGSTNRGAYVHLLFKDSTLGNGNVILGDSSVWPLSGCASAPLVYGELASPDLNGDTYVDSSDLTLFAQDFLGNSITASSGWQADFNHTGGQVDSGDTAYLAGRLGVDCNSSKAGVGNYQMNVNNLLDSELLAFLAEHDMTPAQVISEWNKMGLSYNSSLVPSVLAAHPVENESWSNMKRAFK